MKDGCWTILSVYAPQTGCSEEEKDKFYITLDDVIRSVSEGEFPTVAGDLNGHVGTNRRGWKGRLRHGYLQHILRKEGKPQGDLQQWGSNNEIDPILIIRRPHHLQEVQEAAVAKAMNAEMGDPYEKLEEPQAEKFAFRLAKGRHRAS
ncbi:unnamed protein product [Nippostrongylus brasiliensis]|uniref:Endo/exonuclease/phosphatase domain-containing protein n=1 Tax=Nippostrongylus brasiliensis TaxID=27835 RepID=A0A0N4Y283_NIPBR|nr:unnamed protein product [Nippostrongylus brasiliensis]